MSSRISRVQIGAFLAATVIGAIAAASSDAKALYTRSHAARCMTFNGSVLDSGWAIQNNSTASRMQMLCPVTDDDRFPKGSIADLNVHGHDGNNNTGDSGIVFAMTCRADAFSTGGGCSTPVATSATGTGAYTLEPGFVFGTATDFVYLWVELPIKDGSSLSSLRGYYTAN